MLSPFSLVPTQNNLCTDQSNTHRFESLNTNIQFIQNKNNIVNIILIGPMLYPSRSYFQIFIRKTLFTLSISIIPQGTGILNGMTSTMAALCVHFHEHMCSLALQLEESSNWEYHIPFFFLLRKISCFGIYISWGIVYHISKILIEEQFTDKEVNKHTLNGQALSTFSIVFNPLEQVNAWMRMKRGGSIHRPMRSSFVFLLATA